MPELTCEACKAAPANNGDILCTDCGHDYAILLDLLRKHPEMGKDDFTRLKELFDWRSKNEEEWLQSILRKPESRTQTLT